MLAKYVIYFLFPKTRNRFNRLLYTCIHTSSRLLKLGSNFREICLARRVSTARSHPYYKHRNIMSKKPPDMSEVTEFNKTTFADILNMLGQREI